MSTQRLRKAMMIVFTAVVAMMFSVMIFVACDSDGKKAGKEETYAVSVDAAITGGVVSTSKTEAKAGDRVEVYVTASSGYVLQEGSLKFNDTAIEDYEFVMPAEDVTIHAVFEETVYSVNVAQATNGTVSVSAPTAKAGDTVTVTVKPEAGYCIAAEGLTYNGIGLNTTLIDAEREIGFTMPASNVEIACEFLTLLSQNISETFGSADGVVYESGDWDYTSDDPDSDTRSISMVSTAGGDYYTYFKNSLSDSFYVQTTFRRTGGTTADPRIGIRLENAAGQKLFWSVKETATGANAQFIMYSTSWNFALTTQVKGWNTALIGEAFENLYGGEEVTIGLLRDGTDLWLFLANGSQPAVITSVDLTAYNEYFDPDAECYAGFMVQGAASAEFTDYSWTEDIADIDTQTYLIMVDTPVNGAIEISAGQAKAGDTVNVTVTPDSGYCITENNLSYNGKGMNNAVITEETTVSFTMEEGVAVVRCTFTDVTMIGKNLGNASGQTPAKGSWDYSGDVTDIASRVASISGPSRGDYYTYFKDSLSDSFYVQTTFRRTGGTMADPRIGIRLENAAGQKLFWSVKATSSSSSAQFILYDKAWNFTLTTQVAGWNTALTDAAYTGDNLLFAGGEITLGILKNGTQMILFLGQGDTPGYFLTVDLTAARFASMFDVTQSCYAGLMLQGAADVSFTKYYRTEDSEVIQQKAAAFTPAQTSLTLGNANDAVRQSIPAETAVTYAPDYDPQTSADTSVTISSESTAWNYLYFEDFRSENLYAEVKISGANFTSNDQRVGLFVQNSNGGFLWHAKNTASATNLQASFSKNTLTGWFNPNFAAGVEGWNTVYGSGKADEVTLGILKYGDKLYLFVDGEYELTADLTNGVYQSGTASYAYRDYLDPDEACYVGLICTMQGEITFSNYYASAEESTLQAKLALVPAEGGGITQ